MKRPVSPRLTRLRRKRTYRSFHLHRNADCVPERMSVYVESGRGRHTLRKTKDPPSHRERLGSDAQDGFPERSYIISLPSRLTCLSRLSNYPVDRQSLHEIRFSTVQKGSLRGSRLVRIGESISDHEHGGHIREVRADAPSVNLFLRNNHEEGDLRNAGKSHVDSENRSSSSASCWDWQ